MKTHSDLPSFLELSARPLTLGQEEYLPGKLGSQADTVRNGEQESLFHGFPEGAVDQLSVFPTGHIHHFHFPEITSRLVNLILVVVTTEVLGKNTGTRGEAGEHVSKQGRHHRARAPENTHTQRQY